MQDINSVAIGGRLTADSKLHKFESGSDVVQFTIASNTSVKKDGQWADKPNFVNIKYYGKNLDKFASFLSKGTPVTVQGKLDLESWEKDGKKSSQLVIKADQVKIEGYKKSDDSSDAVSQSSDEIQEDIPF